MALFHRLNMASGGFQVDLCADSNNRLCPIYFSEEHSFLELPDGLLRGMNCFCNPPFDAELIAPIVDKVIAMGKAGVDITIIVPLTKGEQEWFLKLVKNCCDMIFIQGRVQYGRDPNLPAVVDEKTGKVKKHASPPGPSCIFRINGNAARCVSTLGEITPEGDHWNPHRLRRNS